jgi:hypothetical protein
VAKVGKYTTGALEECRYLEVGLSMVVWPLVALVMTCHSLKLEVFASLLCCSGKAISEVGKFEVPDWG